MSEFENVETREQAIALAQSIVAGRTSRHHNLMMELESSSDRRTETLARIAQADAADVVSLCALAGVLPSAPARVGNDRQPVGSLVHPDAIAQRLRRVLDGYARHLAPEILDDLATTIANMRAGDDGR